MQKLTVQNSMRIILPQVKSYFAHGYSLSFSFLFHLFILNFFQKMLVSATDNAPQGSAAEWRENIFTVQFQISKALVIYFVENNS